MVFMLASMKTVCRFKLGRYSNEKRKQNGFIGRAIRYFYVGFGGGDYHAGKRAAVGVAIRRQGMFKLLDKIAGWWLDFSADYQARHSQEMQNMMREFKLKKFDANQATFFTPTAAILADGLAQMLDEANAENYVQFDMLPRLDRGLRPIRVTVQWANGESPAEQNARLREELSKIETIKNARVEYAHENAQKDPIFLLQWARVILEHDAPVAWCGECEGLYKIHFDHNCMDEENRNMISNKELLDYGWAREHWETESVFLSREEAETYAAARQYHYPHGWRVFCVSAIGELAELLGRTQ